MKTIRLDEVQLDLDSAINLARYEPLLFLTADGQKFFMTLADEVEHEVETLRQSQAFQRFLDERSASPRRIPLEQIEAEIERELAAHAKSAWRVMPGNRRGMDREANGVYKVRQPNRTA